jgi:predicted nucleotidyltransferase/HEPN domain-containing protein
MKTSLSHLPESKQAQLRAITAIFCEGAPVEMLILFGSHARGDWVEDPETGYVSDFDVLAVVETEKQSKDLPLWNKLEQQAREVAGKSPVTLIVHDIRFLNHEVRSGQFFFADIVNEGVLLHDSRKFQLARPKALNAQERLALAERNFVGWFDSASGFWRGSRYFASTHLLKHAAFLLHQATERYYVAALLVFTGYKHRTHDIEKLGNLAGAQHPLLLDVFPRAEPADADLFELLKKAYIDARYSMSYQITAVELQTLQERVLVLGVLGERVRAACIEKLGSFCGTETVRKDLPVPPRIEEPLLANLPAPPTEPAEFQQWAQSLVELSEQRGEERGEAKGREEGQRVGEEKGRRDGEMQRGAADILRVLRIRGLPVPAEVERRIATCTDPELLSRWLERAVIATDAAEVLAA